MRGTTAAFNSLLEGPDKPNVDTLYFISDYDSSKAKLYLGSKLIAGEGVAASLDLKDLSDVVLTSDLKDKTILIYNKNSGKWTNSSLVDAISTFGANTAGLVPAPQSERTDLFLRSDGKWMPITSYQDKNNTISIIENENSEILHQDVINSAMEDIVLCVGDIVIIKDIISQDVWSHTSYVYNGASWCAMDGNYNAENIYFDEDFIFTKSIGTVNVPSTGSISVEAAGKNLKDFLSSLFSEEELPIVTYPYINFINPKETKFEVGNKINIDYSLSFNNGSYSYDTDTGVQVKSWIVSDGTNEKYEKNGVMPEIQITDNMNYYLTAVASYSDGIIPKSNLGNKVSEKQIKANNTKQVISKSITGYRNIFGGADITQTLLTSNFIRTNLLPFGDANENKEIIWKASDVPGIKRYILVIPKNAKKTLKSVTITSSMNADATADYIKQENSILVEGENGYNPIDYDIWIYAPASIASTEIHKIIIE